MIDFHSHIIPYVDDGSKNFDMSLDMLRNAVVEGTEYICASSHYIPEDLPLKKEAYNKKFNELLALMKLNDINIHVLPSLELYMHPKLPKLYKQKEIWGINNSRYLLIELPMNQFPLYTEDVFYELRLLGAVPIIAHPERNLRIMKDTSLLVNLVKQGTLAQVNAGSLRGIYGKDIKSTAEKFVDMNLVHMLGSDAHDDKRRTTRISDAFDIVKDRNEELYEWILHNEHNIINNQYIEPLSIKRKRKKSFLFNLFKR